MSKRGRKRKYVVLLNAEDRSYLEGLARKSSEPAGRVMKARILLKADTSSAGEGLNDKEIGASLEIASTTAYRTRLRLAQEGLEAALTRKSSDQPRTEPIFDGEAEARLVQLACSEPPAGHARWSLRLLEKRVVELGIVETASDSTIHRVLKKTNFDLTKRNPG